MQWYNATRTRRASLAGAGLVFQEATYVKEAAMHPVVSICPVCQEEMMVTRLRCPNCSSELHGNFQLSRLNRLDQKQLAFVEALLKNRANVYRAAEELKISYSAARSRLDEVVRALGYPVEEQPLAAEVSPEQRQDILKALSEGKITASDALDMLQAQ